MKISCQKVTSNRYTQRTKFYSIVVISYRNSPGILLSLPWVSENMDSIVNKFVRKWLEIPVSGTLSNVFLTSNKFGLNIYPPSVKFTQCQTVSRKALKTSPNDCIRNLWKSTCDNTNIQYDVYTSTKEVLKVSNLHKRTSFKIICFSKAPFSLIPPSSRCLH